MEELLSACLGLALAAACGFRVFVPPLLLGVASRVGWVELGGGFEWLGSGPALVALSLATVLEIAAYYVPWLDHALDSLATPAAVVAGIVVTASVVTEMAPLLQWTLAVVAGGGLAGSVQIATASARGATTWLTGGLGNPIVATLEAIGATAISLLAFVVPVVALGLVLVFVGVLARRVRRGRTA